MNDGEAIVVHVDADLADLIPEFLDSRHHDVDAIQTALQRQDFETIRVLGHGMKGCGGGFGFDDISELGAALERAAKQGDSETVRRNLERLADYLSRVKIVYEEL